MSSVSQPQPCREAATTRDKILLAGIEEFCEHGFVGANTARIVKRAGCNIRMLYHYFENKDNLYKVALEYVYMDLRQQEDALDLLGLSPRDAIERLALFTFDYMEQNPRFIKMVNSENQLQGAIISGLESIPRSSTPLISSIDAILRKGRATEEIVREVDPLQLYISMVALSFTHLSSRYTLSATFGEDVAGEAFRTHRRRHVVEMIMAYVFG